MTTTRRQMIALAGGGLFAASAVAGCDRPAAAAVGDVDARDRSLGNPNAAVTLIEYASPTCGHCTTFHRDTFPAIQEKYIDTGRIHFVLREALLQSADYYIWLVARCLPEDQYFTFVKLVFDYHERIVEALYKDTAAFHEELQRISRSVGLRAEQYESCIADEAEIERLQAINKSFVDAYDGMRTPSFLINGVYEDDLAARAEPLNQLTIADFEAAIEPLLAEG
ncbi:MAG: DsbA family protein [Caulobacterales bacterium]|nr:DsbA family protein [Caulobacterales bacterium]